MAGKKLTKEQICRRDYDKLFQLVTQRMRSDDTTSFNSIDACNNYIEPTLKNHWFCRSLATQNGHRPSGLRRTMIRMLRFGLQRENKVNLNCTEKTGNTREEQPHLHKEQESVDIDPRILEVARSVHVLTQRKNTSDSGGHENRLEHEENNRPSISNGDQDSNSIDLRILEIARTVQALAQDSTIRPPTKRPVGPEADSDEIVCTGSTKVPRVEPLSDNGEVRNAPASNEPLNYRLNIVQRHRGLNLWELSVRQTSAMIWDGKVHLQQFLNYSTSLGFAARKHIVRYAKFFQGTRIIAKKDWLVPPAFLARHAKLAGLEAEAVGFINLASSHLAEPPEILRCSNCSESHTIASSDIKHMYKHLCKCVGIAEAERVSGFCACGRLFANEADLNQHGQGCPDLQQAMSVIMG